MSDKFGSDIVGVPGLDPLVEFKSIYPGNGRPAEAVMGSYEWLKLVDDIMFDIGGKQLL